MAEIQSRRQKLNFRTRLLFIAMFALVLQPLWSASAFALEPANSAQEKSSLLAPSGGSPHAVVKNTRDFSFTWQYAPGHSSEITYKLRLTQNRAELSDNLGGSVWSSPLLDKPQLSTRSIPDFHDGTWYWQVRAEDAATGEMGPWGKIWEVSVDSVGPTVEILHPSGIGLIDRQEVVFEGTIVEPELTLYSVELDGSDATSQVASRTEAETRYLSMKWPAGTIADGVHLLELTATDATGHTTRVEQSFTIDTLAPDAMTSLVENEKVWGSIILDLNVKEPHLGSLSIVAKTITGDTVSGLQAPVVSGEGTKITRSWNTTAVDDGVYQIVFTATDAAGNQTLLTRNVVVSNFISGVGVTKDPLLEELSASLSQPLAVPHHSLEHSSMSTILSPDMSDMEMRPYDRLLEEVPQFTAVAATENGWQLFGVLWYWWLLGGAVLSGSAMYSRRLLSRTLQQQVPDGV